MILLKEAVEAKKMDVRLIDRHLTRGVLEPKELAQALKQMPDETDHAQWTNIEHLMQIDPDDQDGDSAFDS